MDWFIRKVRADNAAPSESILTSLQGQTVEENKPKQLRYQQTFSAEGPPPHTIYSMVFTCPDTDNLGPPKYNDGKH